MYDQGLTSRLPVGCVASAPPKLVVDMPSAGVGHVAGEHALLWFLNWGCLGPLLPATKSRGMRYVCVYTFKNVYKYKCMCIYIYTYKRIVNPKL